MPDSNNLPVKVNNNLIDTTRKNQARIAEIAKKVGKVAMWTGVTGVGVLSMPFSIPVGVGVISVGTMRAFKNATLRNSSDLSFGSRKKIFKDTTLISQDPLRPDIATKLRGYSPVEIGGTMILQTLVGFERFKRELEGSNKEPSNTEGIGIYSKKYELFTHSINIKNMETLEKLGYIVIDKNEPRMKRNIFGKKEPDKRLLIAEKLGFGNYRNVADIFKMALKGDKEGLESQKREMRNIEFRLTDKHIDFEELYDLCNSDNKDISISRLSPIFNSKRGLLAKRPIDIENDRFGMPRINYRSKKSFVERMKERVVVQPKEETLRDRINLRDQFTDELQQDIARKITEKENNENKFENERE